MVRHYVGARYVPKFADPTAMGILILIIGGLIATLVIESL